MAFHIYIASHQGGLPSLPLGKIGSDAAVDNIRSRLCRLCSGQISRQLLADNLLHLIRRRLYYIERIHEFTQRVDAFPGDLDIPAGSLLGFVKRL